MYRSLIHYRHELVVYLIPQKIKPISLRRPWSDIVSGGLTNRCSNSVRNAHSRLFPYRTEEGNNLSYHDLLFIKYLSFLIQRERERERERERALFENSNWYMIFWFLSEAQAEFNPLTAAMSSFGSSGLDPWGYPTTEAWGWGGGMGGRNSRRSMNSRPGSSGGEGTGGGETPAAGEGATPSSRNQWGNSRMNMFRSNFFNPFSLFWRRRK